MKVSAFTVGPFQENAYLVIDEHAGQCVFIDPGDEGPRLLKALRASGATLTAIWLTHAHLDHVGAVAALKREYDVPVYLHPLDRPLYERADRQAAAYGLPFEQPPAPDRELAEGESVSVGEMTFDVLHVPGHAPGHVIFYRDDVAFVGDLIFAGSIGRTDLPGSNPQDMTDSLERVSSTLPAELTLYPGHGPATTMGRELASNPFLNGGARALGG
jgi:glyoxylase-like metal-dependent hydrolase (beta-lactamase superfamily II)